MLRVIRRLCGGFGGGGKEIREKQAEKATPYTNSSTAPNIAENPSSVEMSKTVYQPLHNSVRNLYDPEYVAFHDRYVQFVEPEHLKDWTASIRSRSLWPYAGSPILEVGSVEDLRPCPNFSVRIFRPQHRERESSCPVVVWLHGGGFAGGNIDSDNDLCSLLCRDLDCVVVNVDYRLAPEHPYPAAVEDVVDILKWVSSESGTRKLGIDPNKIVIGGASAGANLATVGALIATELSIPLALQVLVVPVTDNTATVETSWCSHPHAAGLTPQRMTWYRNLYLKDCEDNKHWRISPLYAPTEALARLPKTWIAIAGQDMLSTEGLAYAERLKESGVATDVQVYNGMPHSMMAMSGKCSNPITLICSLIRSGVLRTGRQCMDDLVEVIKRHFRVKTLQRVQIASS